MERTFSIIKPDATKRNITGKINSLIEDNGLRIIAQKRIRLEKSQAEDFYKIHKYKPFFNDLIQYMTSEPVILQVLESENAVNKYREIMDKIEIPICFYTDDEGNKVYDYEAMAEEFENELSKIVGVTVMCSVSEDIIYE